MIRSLILFLAGLVAFLLSVPPTTLKLFKHPNSGDESSSSEEIVFRNRKIHAADNCQYERKLYTLKGTKHFMDIFPDAEESKTVPLSDIMAIFISPLMIRSTA